jgi:hypothetical protein
MSFKQVKSCSTCEPIQVPGAPREALPGKKKGSVLREKRLYIDQKSRLREEEVWAVVALISDTPMVELFFLAPDEEHIINGCALSCSFSSQETVHV